MKRLLFITIYITLTLASYAQTGIVKDFKPACDSIAALLQERTGVKGKVELKSVMKRKGNLDFYFTESLGDFPWYGSGPQWLRNTLKELLPEGYGKFRIGQIYSRRVPQILRRMYRIHFGDQQERREYGRRPCNDLPS